MSTTEELREKFFAHMKKKLGVTDLYPYLRSANHESEFKDWQAAYSQGYNDAREACQAAVASELYGHDTGDMGNRIQEAISSLPIPEAK